MLYNKSQFIYFSSLSQNILVTHTSSGAITGCAYQKDGNVTIKPIVVTDLTKMPAVSHEFYLLQE
jgi:hypothetical protein